MSNLQKKKRTFRSKDHFQVSLRLTTINFVDSSKIFLLNLKVAGAGNKLILFIGPESDHWLCLSLTHSLPNCCLVNLIDVTLACQDAYSKLVEVVTVADVSDKDRVGNSLMQIWELMFGHKA